MPETKNFDIGDILTIITGKLVSRRHMDGVYDICDWMTNDSNMTHQLPRVMDEIKPQLEEDFPDLTYVDVPADEITSQESCDAWLDSLAERFGTDRDVRRLEPGIHKEIGPLTELLLMRGDK
jgi:hypothetical protein